MLIRGEGWARNSYKAAHPEISNVSSDYFGKDGLKVEVYKAIHPDFPEKLVW